MRLGRRRDRRYLYQLPWYVIIGAPGSGKTTALANSGLKFPLSDKMGELAVRGVGGTRNCDWFFTDDAVLIDTAGRYTTQDSDEAVDRSAWQSFLELLRKYRPRSPIEGILVAFCIADLAESDLHQRLAHARAIKRRIQEICH
jgi:type VI secretion system protein ImpL